MDCKENRTEATRIDFRIAVVGVEGARDKGEQGQLQNPEPSMPHSRWYGSAAGLDFQLGPSPVETAPHAAEPEESESSAQVLKAEAAP